MQSRIYLTGIEKRPGKSFISIGLLSLLMEQHKDLNCFKLFSEDDSSHVKILEQLSNQSIQPIMKINDAISMMRTAPDDLIAQVIEKTQTESSDASLSFFEGSDFESDNDVVEYQFNLSLAYQLKCNVILMISAKNRSVEHTLSLINTALQIAQRNHAKVIGIIVNQIDSQHETAALELYQKLFKHIPLIAVVPEFDKLAHPSVSEIAEKLKAEVLYGKADLNRIVTQFTVAAKTVGHFLESRIDRNGMLIITPDDRVDILLGSLLADQSANYPKIAGIVLTGGEKPGAVIEDIIKGLEHPFPVLLTRLKTYETATTLYSAKYSINYEDQPKIEEAIHSIRPYLLAPLSHLKAFIPEKALFSPAIFLYDIMMRAKKQKKHIVLPEGDDPRILQAADYLLLRDVVKITLLGKEEKILHQAKRMNLSLPGVQIIDNETSGDLERYAKVYFELRKHKNVNYPIALERVSDANYFGVMMTYLNDADGMVSGAMHTTADTVRPALEVIKTKKGVGKVSSIFIMCLETKVLIYGDCAINPEPDSQLLAEIAAQAAEISDKLGIDPKVALLSYSSGESGKGESVEKVSKALELIKKTKPNYIVEGPIQYDAAVDPEVAHKKLPHSKLAGEANVLIFPDLNTGNNTYKAVQRESGALAIGPVLLGLNKPVNDLSRGCTPQDVINTILITAIQAQSK